MLPEEKGLTSAEAKKRLERYGPNTLPEKPPPSDFEIFISQLKNPLVYILVIAGIVTILLNHVSDAIIIFFAVFVNTILGFVQERRASKSLQALKELVHPTAEVIRDGEIKEIDVEKLVPGDIVILSQGDKIPADGKLVEANRVFVSEAILTGESVPVGKKEEGEVFMGTIVTAGRASMEIEVTGEHTKMGKIAERVQEPEEDTPLRKQIKNLSKQLSILVFVLTTIVFAIGFLTGKDLVEIFTTSVALAVSSIPEGLLVGLTVVLAIGMQRILRRKGLVRSLISAETLGGVTTICVDKTGTLTEGKLQVVEHVGDIDSLANQTIIANDLDDPIVIAAWDWATKELKFTKQRATKLRQRKKRLDSIPFSPKERFFASLNKWDKKNNMIFVNGAPEFLLEWSMLNKKEKKKYAEEIQKLTAEGKRVVGLARKKVSLSKNKLSEKDVKNALKFVGLLAFSDPVRKGVAKAFEKTRKAGIESIVITGDYPQTAVAVMKQLNFAISDQYVMLGDELAKTSKKKLRDKLSGEERIKLFARTTPEQKLKIVEALKENGEVIAMMGDGVNDAPALKRADIGVVVGEASDVAKETADLVLLDSSFETIVGAVEEGRGIFDNIRKIILYLMSDAFSEIVAVVGTLVLGLPLAVTAGQILWINLVSDGFPDLALTIDPKAEDIMERKPKPPWEPIATRWMKMLIAIVSVVGGLIGLLAFIYYYNITNDAIYARSVAFAVLGVNSLVYVFSIRTLTKPFWVENPLENKWLNAAVFVGLIFQFIPFSTPYLREFFGLTFPGYGPILMAFLAAGFVFIIIEVIKEIVRKHLEWFQH